MNGPAKRCRTPIYACHYGLRSTSPYSTICAAKKGTPDMNVRRFVAAVAALVLSTSATAETWAENRREFHAELARQCPQKHLEYMFQSEMLDVFDSFYESLSPEKRAEFDRAAEAE